MHASACIMRMSAHVPNTRKELVMTLARAPYLFRIFVPANDLEACGHPPCSRVWTFFKLRSVWMGRYTLPASCMTPPAWRAHEIVALNKKRYKLFVRRLFEFNQARTGVDRRARKWLRITARIRVGAEFA